MTSRSAPWKASTVETLTWLGGAPRLEGGRRFFSWEGRVQKVRKEGGNKEDGEWASEGSFGYKGSGLGMKER